MRGNSSARSWSGPAASTHTRSSGASRGKTPTRLCGEIDDKVNGFLDRSLEGDWPYLWLDATYVKVREAGPSLPTSLRHQQPLEFL